MKTCVLFSGGWDSAAAALWHYNLKPDLLFISYGQTYINKELLSAKDFAQAIGLKLHTKSLDLSHDHPLRNLYLILEAKRLGYDRIVFGSRNLAPLFDKYKDSNWLGLKIFSWLMKVDLKLPVTGWPKRLIIWYVRRHYKKPLYNCLQNKQDYKSCDCKNCLEIRLFF